MKMIMLIALSIMLTYHPLLMTIMILIQTLVTSMITSSWTSPWVGMILFLVFSGGMLVMFINITSIISNETFPPMKLVMYSILTMTPLLIPLNFSFNEMTIMYSENPTSIMMKLFSSNSFLTTLMMMLYLLLTLFVIVFITDFKTGPMRKTIN